VVMGCGKTAQSLSQKILDFENDINKDYSLWSKGGIQTMS
jgi:hypothetical protein